VNINRNELYINKIMFSKISDTLAIIRNSLPLSGPKIETSREKRERNERETREKREKLELDLTLSGPNMWEYDEFVPFLHIEF